MIHINLLRISTDSQYLEFIVECSEGYLFNHLNITRYNVRTKADDETIDLSNVFTGTATQQVVRIATNTLGISGDTDVTMYTVEFGVTQNVNYPGYEDLPDLENEVGVCSNVNFVYANMLDLAMKFTNCCISDSDLANLNRNHIILYAHQEAMRLERYVEATYFYDIIWAHFINCGPTVRQRSTVTTPCNCG